MTFFPDGETDIPNQTPVPGIRGSQVPPGRPQAPAVPGAPPRTTVDPQLNRAIIRAAMINGVVLVVAVLLAYVFPVSSNETYATFIVLGAAIFSGINLMIAISSQQRRRRQQALTAGVPTSGTAYGQVQAVTGAQPYGGADAQPYGAVQPASAPGGFTMPVEDVFSITGRGTVVTGRVGSGQLRTGQLVAIQRHAQTLAEVEVAGIEMFRKTTDVATVGDNIGVLLKGVSRADVQRGDVLSA